MRKIYTFILLTFVCTNIAYADLKSEAQTMVYKAQECYFSLPSYAQDGAIDSWLETKNGGMMQLKRTKWVIQGV